MNPPGIQTPPRFLSSGCPLGGFGSGGSGLGGFIGPFAVGWLKDHTANGFQAGLTFLAACLLTGSVVAVIVGRKVKVLLNDVDLVRWKQDLIEDRNRLATLHSAARQVGAARDAKLEALRKVIVEKGVAPGETVVTDGQLRLYPGARIEAVPAGKIDSQPL